MLNTNIQTQETITEPYVTNLDEMIGIQPQSIVSKIIAHKSAGTVTMFAFDEDKVSVSRPCPSIPCFS